jgi:hypothetical protein
VFMSAAVPPDQLFAGAGGDEPILDLEGLQVGGWGCVTNTKAEHSSSQHVAQELLRFARTCDAHSLDPTIL